MADAIIRTEGLTKSYVVDGTVVPVLRGIDFALEPGECTVVQGASGVGKSTFLHLLGLLDRPTEGAIWFGDLPEPVSSFSAARLSQVRNRGIGFVFQFHHLLPDLTALDNVMMPGRIAREDPAKVCETATALLGAVGLAERMRHRPHELSGGEQQRVAIARALLLMPKLILADEPTGNLDTETGRAVLDLLVTMNKDHGSALLLVTHNNEHAAQFPRQWVMRDGKLFAQHQHE